MLAPLSPTAWYYRKKYFATPEQLNLLRAGDIVILEFDDLNTLPSWIPVEKTLHGKKYVIVDVEESEVSKKTSFKPHRVMHLQNLKGTDEVTLGTWNMLSDGRFLPNWNNPECKKKVHDQLWTFVAVKFGEDTKKRIMHEIRRRENERQRIADEKLQLALKQEAFRQQEKLRKTAERIERKNRKTLRKLRKMHPVQRIQTLINIFEERLRVKEDEQFNTSKRRRRK